MTPKATRRSDIPLTTNVGLVFGEVAGIQFVKGDYITEGTKVTRQLSMNSKEIQRMIKEGSCVQVNKYSRKIRRKYTMNLIQH